MKYVLLLVLAMPLFAVENSSLDQKLQDELSLGNVIPVVQNGEVTAWTMNPSINELENQKLSNVVEDNSDE